MSEELGLDEAAAQTPTPDDADQTRRETEELDQTMAAMPNEPMSATALESGTVIGRYVVLNELGAGAMGVVHAAYDPELDRKVALKLLHPGPGASSKHGDGHRRLLREAQAMAQLSHPNVVAIHDVGEHAGQVFLAMEFVDGENLGDWLKHDRTWRQVLDIFERAGAGLVAAHTKGLLHRDFKPDNVMVSRDGRVQVMDFGLARTTEAPDKPTTARAGLVATVTRPLELDLTTIGAIVGTPAYMSPEQLSSRGADERSDQFSFCVALWKGLYGERPFDGETLVDLAANVLKGRLREPTGRGVPNWLRRICERGLSPEPDRRFGSMQELLEACSRGRARARLRRILTGAAVGAGVVAMLVSSLAVALLAGEIEVQPNFDDAQLFAACGADGASIEEVWNEEAKTQVRAGLLATNVSYAATTADKVMPWINEQADTWRDVRTQVCVAARVDGTIDEELLERAIWCLDERRMELEALIEMLSHADDKLVQGAVEAAANLPTAWPCQDEWALKASTMVPPIADRGSIQKVRRELSRARVLSSAGKYVDGLDVSRSALAAAEALSWPPLLAAALQMNGGLLAENGSHADAEAANIEAYMIAAKGQSWEVAALAATNLVLTVGQRQERFDEGKVWAGHAEVAVLMAGDPLKLREAMRLNYLGAVHSKDGDHLHARDLLQRGVAIWERELGPDHPDVAVGLSNLGTEEWYLGQFTHASELYERALAIQESVFGVDHPNIAATLSNLSTLRKTRGDYAEALVLQKRALAITERILGAGHIDTAVHIKKLGALYQATGDLTMAGSLVDRALATEEHALGTEHPRVARSLNLLGSIRQATGEYARAQSLYERAYLIQQGTLGPDHPDVAVTLGNLGALSLEMGQSADAIASLERAVRLDDIQPRTQPDEPQHRFDLARALMLTGGARGRALEEAHKAVNGWREPGISRPDDLARAESWLEKHTSSDVGPRRGFTNASDPLP